MSSNNPLKQYFRRPMLTCRLPSQYRYYEEGVVDRTATGELDVYPMTSIDEITVRTPDLLFNGEAVARVIQNCIPAVRDPWKVTAVDINAMLISIKIASNGQYFDINSYCPYCNHENTFSADLTKLLQQVRGGDYTKPLILGDLKVHFKPLTYHDVNENNKRQFEIQKLATMVGEMDESEDKNNNLSEIMKQFNVLAVEILMSTIDYIETPETEVNEHEFIHEFLTQCDRATGDAIRDHSVALSKQNDIPDIDATCTSEECGKTYKQRMNLNVTDFFG